MIHWRVRTEYSYGETFAPIQAIVERLKELGCQAAAITDLGGTWGHVPWVKACQAAGIKPMLGVEIVVSDDEEQRTMAFVARNAEGLKELYHATSLAHRQMLTAKRGKAPRLYLTDVRAMSDDIIKLAGEILDPDFLKEVDALIDISPASMIMKVSKERIAASAGLRVIHCCDNAYAREEDRPILEITAPRSLKPSPQHLYDCGETQADLLPEFFDLPKAPLIKVPNAHRKLWALCRKGIKYRAELNALAWTEEYEARLKREMELIKEKNFASYFLVVADMCDFAKQHMLVGPSRGSAAGSLVCYLTRITEIDPLPPGLIFERFIDTTREDLPDIDLDFPDKKRYMVFDYMAKKYGAENVAHIGTISRYQAKSALVATCKRMGIPASATAPVKVAMIERSSADSRASDCLRDTLDTTDPGKRLKEMYPEVMVAAEIEGHASHTGVHAAGLLVCNEPIKDYCTVTAEGIAQIEKYSAEDLNLLKIDVLGLRTLTVLDEANVLNNEGWYSLPLDDAETLRIFDDQMLSGIFQFEGNALRSISKRMVPFKSMHDIDAVTALARPGPFSSGITEHYLNSRNAGRKVTAHPLVAEHMTKTEGLPIYQEQTLAICRNIGKFSWADTTSVRKAISKRLGNEYFETFWQKFRKGAMENGLPEEEARAIWDSINTMGAWQMNKAHTYSYAVLSYWTAWLKAHHPLPFVLSCLRSGMDDEKGLSLIREMVGSGRIKHKPLDWKVAQASWSVQDGALMPGLDSAKGFGPKLSEKFVSDREAGKLTAKQIEKIQNAEKLFDDLFPIEHAYASYYNGEEQVAGKVYRLAEIDGSQDGHVVFIGKVIYKNLRDANEEVNVKKRGGKVLPAPVTYLDFRVQDDTEQLLLRIGRFDYERMGKTLFNRVPIGAVLLIRAKMIPGYRFGWVNKWRRIDGKPA